MPDDLDRCLELVTQARTEAALARGGDLLALLGPGRRGGGDRGPESDDPGTLVDRWITGGADRSLLVGVFSGAIVGLAAGEVVATEPNATGRRLGRVDLCYVEPEARQVGVGASLVAALLSWFGERDCTDVDALALPGDRSTKQLLETAGFKARLLVLHRRLP